MKIKVTYDKEDILKLIHRDLKANGLKHDLSAAIYKGTANVSIEVEGAPADELAFVTQDDAPPPVVAPVAPVRKPPAAGQPPQLAIAEDPIDDGGDMSEILSQSRKNANDKKPMYDPDRVARPLMEGESTEWPGAPTPRSR